MGRLERGDWWAVVRTRCGLRSLKWTRKKGRVRLECSVDMSPILGQ